MFPVKGVSGRYGISQGEGAPVSIKREIAEDLRDYEPSTDTVRFPTLLGSDGPVASETESFETRADRKCASIGSEALLAAIRNRFEKEVQGIWKAVGEGDTGEDLGVVITVSVTTRRNRDGDTVSEPNISVRAVVDRTPRTVHATITLGDREHTRSVPIFVEENEVHDL